MLLSSYKNLTTSIKLRHDPSQLELVALLSTYCEHIITNKGHFFDHIKSFFAKDSESEIKKMGVYVWGEVGRGKTMIMDLFFNHLKNVHKKRLHFHQFMIEFHRLLAQYNSQDNTTSQDQSIESVLKLMIGESKILCLDELQVNNITDAMVLYRVLDHIFKNRVLLFLTSNFAPDMLFEDGLQRENFLPCIELMKEKMDIFRLNNHTDYRLEKISHIEKLYYYPLDDEVHCYIQLVLSELIGEHSFVPRQIKVAENRSLTILKGYGKTAVFSFAELFKVPLGILDYLAICNNFRTIIITDITQMRSDDHNEALRFITLIDCIYDHKNKLVCTAEVAIDDLYYGNKHKTEFKRTISRLYEMQSAAYLRTTSET